MIHAMVSGLSVGLKVTDSGASGRLVLDDGSYVDWSTTKRRVTAVVEAAAVRTPVSVVGELRVTNRGLELIAEQALALAPHRTPAGGAAALTLPDTRSRLLAALRWLAGRLRFPMHAPGERAEGQSLPIKD